MTSPPLLLPAAPPGGGYLVLSAAHLSSLDFLCAVRTHYPNTRIVVQQPIPTSGPVWREGRVAT